MNETTLDQQIIPFLGPLAKAVAYVVAESVTISWFTKEYSIPRFSPKRQIDRFTHVPILTEHETRDTFDGYTNEISVRQVAPFDRDFPNQFGFRLQSVTHRVHDLTHRLLIQQHQIGPNIPV